MIQILFYFVHENVYEVLSYCLNFHTQLFFDIFLLHPLFLTKKLFGFIWKNSQHPFSSSQLFIQPFYHI